METAFLFPGRQAGGISLIPPLRQAPFPQFPVPFTQKSYCYMSTDFVICLEYA